MNIIEETIGTYRVEITGMTIRQIKDVFEDKWGAMVWSGGAAYPSGDIKLQFKGAQPAQTAQIPEAAILRRAKYHLWPADEDGPESYEIYRADVDCDDCIDVLIVRFDMLAPTSPKEGS